MAPSFLVDMSKVDLDRVMFAVQDIEKLNPHRGAMRMLDGVTWQSEDGFFAIAWKDIRDDEFWVPGHIPGRPVFPGVLMIEVAAQMCSFMYQRRLSAPRFLGFVGVDDVKFRGQVVPGDRFWILAEELEFKARRAICRCQGVVDGNLVFEGTIRGMPI